jgi:cytochrome c oxidase subunit I+III
VNGAFVPRRAQRGAASLDVRDLPSYAFGPRSLMWWGTWGMIAIEATVFALAAMSYFYIRTHVGTWPPGVSPPDLLWGTINLALVLVSVLPNALAKRAAERRDLERARRWTWTLVLMGVAASVIRFIEFDHLHCRWDTNAYGSIVWALLGLHTVHLLTDVYDTVVLGVLLVTGPLEGKRFVDIGENAMYWNFVVIAWIPIYLIIYVVPRIA